mmetsp:Transcript_43732/g.126318  ORF Transcript_43732/g.126318 Transcript_43732/m.126318 type:complete len:536 (+) Transcript_43732:40-1647(+)
MTTLALRQRPVLAASIVGVGAAVLLRLARYLRRLRSAGQEVPFAPGWVPVLGHLPAIMKYAGQNNKLSLGLHAMAVREETGQSVYKIDMPMMGVALTVISDPDLAEELSHGDPHRFTKDFGSFGSSINVMMDIMGDTGLFFAATDREDDAWGVTHRILKAPFSTKGMKNMFPVMCEQADKLVEALKRDVGYGGVTHIDKWVTKMAFETIAMCGLGISFGSFDDDKEHPFIEALNGIMCDLRTYAMCPWLLRPILCRSAYRRLQDAKSLLRGTCTEVVRQRRDHTTSAVGRGTDLMDMMLNDKDPQTGKAMTEKMIVDNVLTFLFAGQDSTAAAMATCLCFLASCPDAKARLFKEIDEVVGAGDLEWEHLSRLSYLDGCIRETLRLVPPASGAVRAAKGDQLLGGKWRVAHGENALISFMALHYDTKLWGPDAAVFRPERWVSGPPHKYAFLPFASGPRACTGREFTLIEQKITMVKLLQHFDFRRPAMVEAEPGYKTVKHEDLMPPLKFNIDVEFKTTTAFTGVYSAFELLKRGN